MGGLVLADCSPGEPRTLSNKPIADSFGVGSPEDPVKWNQPKKKAFDFVFASPVPAMAFLHYRARDLSAGEVVISLNDGELAQAPADAMHDEQRDHEVLLSRALLQKGLNQLVFENTTTEPGSERWRIWNLWVEVALVPEWPTTKPTLLPGDAGDSASGRPR